MKKFKALAISLILAISFINTGCLNLDNLNGQNNNDGKGKSSFQLPNFPGIPGLFFGDN